METTLAQGGTIYWDELERIADINTDALKKWYKSHRFECDRVSPAWRVRLENALIDKKKAARKAMDVSMLGRLMKEIKEEREYVFLGGRPGSGVERQARIKAFGEVVMVLEKTVREIREGVLDGSYKEGDGQGGVGEAKVEEVIELE